MREAIWVAGIARVRCIKASMTPLLIADIAVGSICVAVGFLHLAVFLRRRDLKVHLFFTLMAIGAGVSVLTDPWMITAQTVPSFVSALKFRITFEAILWIALIWFIDAYTRTARRSLVWVLTAAYALALLLNFFLPFGILFSQISHLHSLTFAWGEKIVFAHGSLSLWRFLPDAAFICLLFFAGESCYRLYRKGNQRRRALGLGISFFLILGVGYVDGILMDLGIADPPSLIGLTFLALVLVMGGQLTDEVVRASALTRKMAVERERMDIILSALNTSLALMDAELNVVWVNEGTRKAFPWDDPVGKKCYTFAENLKEPCEGCGRSRHSQTERYTKRNGSIPPTIAGIILFPFPLRTMQARLPMCLRAVRISAMGNGPKRPVTRP